MRTLFNTVFGEEMSQALWVWKYGDQRGYAVGVWDADNQLVAHYAGFPRQVLMFGEPITAMQMGDVMVLPHARGSLSRTGPFFLATSRFLEAFVGYHKLALLGYGFPNDRHMQLGSRRGLYADNGRVVNLQWSDNSSRSVWWLTQRPFDAQQRRWQRSVDRLFQRMAASLPNAILPIRDAAWVTHRYLQHPTIQYELRWISHRFTGLPVALLIYRVLPGSLEWIDVIATRESWPLCAKMMLNIAAEHGVQLVNLWLSKVFSQDFGDEATITDLGITIPCNTWTAGPATAVSRDRWFLTSGDTDFK